jgi:hypothetical protein
MLSKQTVKEALATAQRLGDDFMDSPPLIQAANVRLKLSRIAIAIAMRTFSCDAQGRCVVLPIHIRAAEDFLRIIYGNPNFGYETLSQQHMREKEEIKENMDDVMQFIVSRPGLMRFLKTTPVFDRFALETVMNVPREYSGAIINDLWDYKAVRFEDGKVKLTPEVLQYIREK